ncbi:MAG TPA: MobF family relaxase [Solirubrobacterales bacterium]|nr:MobF family relaxase [Solirubrobacterales bacterium]
MLTIGKIGDGKADYYLGKVAEGAEDYYSGEGETAGQWLGDGSEELGLDGEVGPDQLVGMLSGRNPVDGEPLGLRHVAEPVPGFDLTFSAPKSVSLLGALGGPEVGAEIAAAHAAAVKAALGYVQRHAGLTRRGAGGHEVLLGEGFIAAGYVHRSSRSGDPQLHTHTLIANATRADGRFTRLYHPPIYDHAKTAGYLYEAEIRAELSERLGVRWQEVRNGIAEIEGFDDEHLRFFSKRRAEILEAAGPEASARSRQVANLETRRAKEDLSGTDLRERWRSQAESIGLGAEQLAGVRERASAAERDGAAAIQMRDGDQRRIGGAVTERRSHFDRRDVVQTIAAEAESGAPVAVIEAAADAFLASPDIVALGAGAKGERYTTKAIWELERRALETAGELAEASDGPLAGELLSARALSARPTMKPDQREMVEALLSGHGRLAIVIGEAGTGKSYAIAAAAEGWAGAGIGVRVTAPTWRAANVLRAEGLEATSVAGFLAEADRAARKGERFLRYDTVLLVDEAAMVDSRTLARLVEHARAANIKLVLVGDPAQLGEIEAGGLFAALAERHEVITLDEVIRHRFDLDREAAKRIRAGEGRQALTLYESEQRVVVCADAEARREAMVTDWWQSFSRGEDSVMIAKRNAEVGELNALAREVMRAEGRLGQQEIEVAGQRFAPGDQVITRVNDHRAQIYNRERWRVADVDVDAQTVELDGIDTRRRVCVDSVYLGRANEADGSGAIQLGYAASTYQAQGSTAERAYVAADPSMDRQELYVAASRTRGETWFYATPEIQLERAEIGPFGEQREGLGHIARAAERDGAQVAAHDEALRSSLAKLSTQELLARRPGTVAEETIENRHDGLAAEIARAEARVDRLATEHERRLSEPHPERERAAEREQRLRGIEVARDKVERARGGVEELRRELAELPPVPYAARTEVAVIDHILAERERVQITALALSPPPYIEKELGPRPTDTAERQKWERAVAGIESYRQRHGLANRDTAIGQRPNGDPDRRREWQRVERLIDSAQRSLGLERTQQRDLGMGLEL